MATSWSFADDYDWGNVSSSASSTTGAATTNPIYYIRSNRWDTIPIVEIPPQPEEPFISEPIDSIAFPRAEVPEDSVSVSISKKYSNFEKEWLNSRWKWINDHRDLMVAVHRQTGEPMFWSDDVAVFETKFEELTQQFGKDNIILVITVFR